MLLQKAKISGKNFASSDLTHMNWNLAKILENVDLQIPKFQGIISLTKHSSCAHMQLQWKDRTCLSPRVQLL